MDAENNKENKPFIVQWPLHKHKNVLKYPDILHLIIELSADKRKVGYVILAGLNNENRSLELMRIVIIEKNKGYGSEAIEKIKNYAFEKLEYHRIWLDVKEFNTHAKSVYMKCGFKIEGFLRECIFVNNHYKSSYILDRKKNIAELIDFDVLKRRVWFRKGIEKVI